MKEVNSWGCLRTAILLSLSSSIFGSLLFERSFAAPADFPKKEITIIVNSGAGGGRDVVARGVGNTMSKYLGVPIVVMNMPGAGGMRGLEQLYSSAPDGYTIGIGAQPDIILQIIEKTKYDSKKFTYIGNAQHSVEFFFVRSDSPFHSVKDFKTSGRNIKIGTHILGANGTVAYMILSHREDFPIKIVGGYQGVAATALGLVRGEIDANDMVLSAAIPFVRSGQIRPILVLGEKRSPDFPNIPTVGEIGYPDLGIFALYFWFMAPPGVPKARVQILEDALMKTLKDPEFLGWAKGANVDIVPLTGQETSKLALDFEEVLEKYRPYIEKYTK